MSEDDVSKFAEIYEREIPMYTVWGNYVKNYIEQRLEENGNIIEQMLKIAAEPRVKKLDSIISKAFFRKEKSYTDPINQITDKVGIRFVVMVEEQIRLVEDVIVNSDIWTFSKDKDYESAKEEFPNLFIYQSVHYVVRNKREFEIDGTIIQENIPCEIQIRTLEQHAYAELSHDYVYKSGKKIPPEIERNLAKSMALNEITDELFSKVYRMIDEDKSRYNRFMAVLKQKYSFKNMDEKLNYDIFENVDALLKKYTIDAADVVADIEDYIIVNISKRQTMYLFRQPVILILYYLVKNHTYEFSDVWEYPSGLLELVYSDLGMSDER